MDNLIDSIESSESLGGRVVKRRDRATIGRRQLRTFRETEIESWLNSDLF